MPSSRLSSIPRRHYFGVVLLALIGWYVSGLIWPEPGVVVDAEWGGFASTLASVAASMVGLTVAVTALAYALLGTPLLQFLHEKGVLNRLLFDLMACAAFWLVTLTCGLAASMPGNSVVSDLLRLGAAAAIAGLLYFVPVGRAFWLLLRSSGHKPVASMGHDFQKPTDLS